ncbi:MAG: carbohydrate ABC transporter permease [Treponema sp.]|jgi:putative aldouronate transport system permease protein|nr:carbohydrate ABC transporter permease [Treponema sp.]
MNKKYIRRSGRDILFNIFNYTFFGIFTLLCILPFYYLFINTISDNDLTRRGLITLLPKGIHFNNYLRVFKLRGLGHAAFVSAARTIIGSGVTVIGSAFAGYLVTKREMWGRAFWYRYIIVTMYFSAGLVPWYMNMVLLRLTNNFLAYIIPGIVAPFYIILVKTYIESIPASLEESASIDGAGFIRIFVSIIWPLTTPILATIAIFSAVGNWNSFTDTLFLMTDEKYFTLQFVLYRYLNEANYLASIIRSGTAVTADAAQASRALTARTIQMTISMVTVFPILLVYPFLQRFFVKGIMIGAVKG